MTEYFLVKRETCSICGGKGHTIETGWIGTERIRCLCLACKEGLQQKEVDVTELVNAVSPFLGLGLTVGEAKGIANLLKETIEELIMRWQNI